MAKIHNACLTSSLSGIFKSSEYSDMTIRCGSEEFKVHRAIVCPRSTFFSAACNGGFQVSDFSSRYGSWCQKSWTCQDSAPGFRQAIPSTQNLNSGLAGSIEDPKFKICYHRTHLQGLLPSESRVYGAKRLLALSRTSLANLRVSRGVTSAKFVYSRKPKRRQLSSQKTTRQLSVEC